MFKKKGTFIMENIKHINVSFEDIKKVSTLGDKGKKISFNIVLNVNIKEVEKEKKKRLIVIYHYKNLHKAMIDQLSNYVNKMNVIEDRGHFLYLIDEYRTFLSEFITKNINSVLEEYEKNNINMNLFSLKKEAKEELLKKIFNPKEAFHKDLNKILIKIDNLKKENSEYTKIMLQIQKMSKDLFVKLVERIERSYKLYNALHELKYDMFRVFVIFENNDFFIEFIGKQNNSYIFNWEAHSEYLKMLIANKIRQVWNVQKAS